MDEVDERRRFAKNPLFVLQSTVRQPPATSTYNIPAITAVVSVAERFRALKPGAHICGHHIVHPANGGENAHCVKILCQCHHAASGNIDFKSRFADIPETEDIIVIMYLALPAKHFVERRSPPEAL